MSKVLSRRQVLQRSCLAASALALPSCGTRSSSAGEIDIVMTAGVSGLVVQEVARQQGFFDQFNVVPKVLVVSDGVKWVAALRSGAAKICMWSGFNQLTPAIEKGAKIKILAGALNLASLALYSANPRGSPRNSGNGGRGWANGISKICLTLPGLAASTTTRSLR